MPLIQQSTYQPPRFLGISHIQTIYPSVFRTVDGIRYNRERLQTPDGDFLDLDWSCIGSKKLILGLHGLEGDSNRAYIRALVKFFNMKGWDGLGLNFRSCSGVPNNLLRSYHSGETEDIHQVIQHIVSLGKYDEVVIAGFSLGGNVTFKYLGEQGKNVHPIISKAVGVSVPVDLTSCSHELAKWKNAIYQRSFMNSLKEKLVHKKDKFANEINFDALFKATTFYEFDNEYTAPVHGFKNAEDYWKQSSSKPYLPEIKVPTLLVNAKNDTFLSDQCYPIDIAKQHKYIHLEMPEKGGHVGFMEHNPDGFYWVEKRIWNFIDQKA